MPKIRFGEWGMGHWALVLSAAEVLGIRNGEMRRWGSRGSVVAVKELIELKKLMIVEFLIVKFEPLSFADEYLSFADEYLRFGDEPLSFVDEPLSFVDEPLSFGDEPLSFVNEPLRFGDEPLSLKFKV